MPLDPVTLSTAISGVKSLVEHFFPNKTEQEKQELAAMLTLMQGQQETNKVEAASSSLWVAGWRPYVGWIAGTALGLIYIPKALVMCAIWAYQAIVIIGQWNGTGTPPTIPAYPDLGLTDLIGLLMSMLGMGYLRSQDKARGVATAAISRPGVGPQSEGP